MSSARDLVAGRRASVSVSASSDGSAGSTGSNHGGVSAGPISIGTGSGALGAVRDGQISLALLEGMAVGLILFYLWTHSLQKGL